MKDFKFNELEESKLVSILGGTGRDDTQYILEEDYDNDNADDTP